MDNHPLHDAVKRSDAEEAERLLLSGVNPGGFDNFGQTPLHWAVFGGYFDCAELLLRHGADVNAVADDLMTPLDRAEDFGLEKIAILLRFYGGKNLADLSPTRKRNSYT